MAIISTVTILGFISVSTIRRIFGGIITMQNNRSMCSSLGWRRQLGCCSAELTNEMYYYQLRATVLDVLQYRSNCTEPIQWSLRTWLASFQSKQLHLSDDNSEPAGWHWVPAAKSCSRCTILDTAGGFSCIYVPIMRLGKEWGSCRNEVVPLGVSGVQSCAPVHDLLWIS